MPSGGECSCVCEYVFSRCDVSHEVGFFALPLAMFISKWQRDQKCLIRARIRYAGPECTLYSTRTIFVHTLFNLIRVVCKLCAKLFLTRSASCDLSWQLDSRSFSTLELPGDFIGQSPILYSKCSWLFSAELNANCDWNKLYKFFLLIFFLVSL